MVLENNHDTNTDDDPVYSKRYYGFFSGYIAS